MVLISIIGSGRVGTSAAVQMILRELGDLMLIDVVKGLPQGEALDLSHMAAMRGIDVEVSGSNDYRDITGSDVVVVTAGLVRKPDMTRLDLLQKNAKIVGEVAIKIREYAPRSIIVQVTNPLDVMTYVALKTSQFRRERVLGFSGLLDIGRYRYYLAKALNVSYTSIVAPILGEHGDSMVLLPEHTWVGGRRLTELLDKAKLAEVIDMTRRAGAEVISLKGWSAHHAPGEGIAEMVDAIVKDRKMVIPSSILLDGEYDVRGVCTVVPVVLGREGAERVVELDLPDEARASFLRSVDVIRRAQAEVDSLLRSGF